MAFVGFALFFYGFYFTHLSLFLQHFPRKEDIFFINVVGYFHSLRLLDLLKSGIFLVQVLVEAIKDHLPIHSINFAINSEFQLLSIEPLLELKHAIRDLAVVADLPAASAEEIVISLNRKIFSPAEHVINVEIDDVSPETYEFARSTSCNTGYRMWFSTPEHIYGGTDGILAMVNLRPQIERGAQSVNKLVGTITWSAKFSAERNINPYAA